MSDLGKDLRLGRIFNRETGTTIILPMDHGIEGPNFTQLEQPGELVSAVAEAGVNAFLMRRGMARATASEYAGRAGWICRLTGRTGLSPGRELEQLVLASVEQAARNGADAVVPTFFIGPDTEADQFTAFGRIADECNAHGRPLGAENFPAGAPGSTPYDGPYSVDDMRVAVRLASEEGADFIKTWYSGDAESFRKIVDYSLVPVVIAGGASGPDPLDTLRMVAGAMEAGAAGIAVGRRVWQSADPAAMVRALQRLVHERASVEVAAGELTTVTRG